MQNGYMKTDWKWTVWGEIRVEMVLEEQQNSKNTKNACACIITAFPQDISNETKFSFRRGAKNAIRKKGLKNQSNIII